MCDTRPPVTVTEGWQDHLESTDTASLWKLHLSADLKDEKRQSCEKPYNYFNQKEKAWVRKRKRPLPAVSQEESAKTRHPRGQQRCDQYLQCDLTWGLVRRVGLDSKSNRKSLMGFKQQNVTQFPFQKISLTVPKRMMGRKKTQNRHCSSDQGKGMLELWPMTVAAETGLGAQDIFRRSDLQTWLQMGCENWWQSRREWKC